LLALSFSKAARQDATLGDHGLYEEMLTIYRKYDQHAMAIDVPVEHIVLIDRGFDYPNKVNMPEV